MPQIRPARRGEEPRLIAAYEWLFEPPGSRPPAWDAERASAALAEAIDSPDAEILVAEAGGELAGFCSIYLDLRSVRFGRRAWVEDLAVEPERRSQGVGRALLDAAKAWAREHGASHLELDSALARTDAHRFYEREGAEYTSYSFGWTL